MRGRRAPGGSIFVLGALATTLCSACPEDLPVLQDPDLGVPGDSGPADRPGQTGDLPQVDGPAADIGPCPSGYIVDGVCCDQPCDEACDACNLPGKIGICSPQQQGVVCRAAATACDAVETCDGQSATCPADQMNTECTPPADNTCTTSCGSTGVKSCTSSCLWGACQPPAEACNDTDDDCDGSKEPPEACHSLIHFHIYDGGFANMQPTQFWSHSAYRFLQDGRVCYSPNATEAVQICRKWFGLPFWEGHPTYRDHHDEGYFRVFDSGVANVAGPAISVFINDSNQACVPGGPGGVCRRWFGLGYMDKNPPEYDHWHYFKCYLFDDNFADQTGPFDSLFFNGALVCGPGPTGAICRKWWGLCETTSTDFTGNP